MEAVREKEPVREKETKSEKKGLISRLRRNKKEGKSTKEQKDAEPVLAEESRAPSPSKKLPLGQSITRDGAPVISSKSKLGKPSDVRNSNRVSVRNGRKIERKSVILDAAPTARDAAFSGPPRYDWIDIETAAAIKVQSVFRRNKVMDDLQEEGIETAAMRNKNRRRRARRARGTVSEDAPGLFACCGMGLMFGDGTEEDDEARRAFETSQYEEKKQKRADYEAKLRAYKPRQKSDFKLNEAIEIVE